MGLVYNGRMNIRIKNYLGVVSICAIATAIIVAFWSAAAYSRSSVSERVFSVNGEGKVVAVPDIAQVTANITTEGGKDMVSLQKQNTERSNKIISFLKEQGVDKKDIKTQSYSVTPRYQYYDCRQPVMYGAEPTSCPPAEIVGYTIQQSISVKVRDLDKVGEILAGVVEQGANNVYGPNFTIDDPEMVRNQARAEAVAQAREKAKAIAKAGGFRLGRLVSINESFYGMPMPMRAGGAEMSIMSDTASAPMIEPGSEDVTVNVSLVYEIK